MQKVQLDHSLTSFKKMNSKWVNNLNGRLETIKLLEENIENKLFDISHNNVILDTSVQVREVKVKIKKWVLIELKLPHSEGKP